MLLDVLQRNAGTGSLFKGHATKSSVIRERRTWDLSRIRCPFIPARSCWNKLLFYLFLIVFVKSNNHLFARFKDCCFRTLFDGVQLLLTRFFLIPYIINFRHELNILIRSQWKTSAIMPFWICGIRLRRRADILAIHCFKSARIPSVIKRTFFFFLLDFIKSSQAGYRLLLMMFWIFIRSLKPTSLWSRWGWYVR